MTMMETENRLDATMQLEEAAVETPLASPNRKRKAAGVTIANTAPTIRWIPSNRDYLNVDSMKSFLKLREEMQQGLLPSPLVVSDDEADSSSFAMDCDDGMSSSCRSQVPLLIRPTPQRPLHPKLRTSRQQPGKSSDPYQDKYDHPSLLPQGAIPSSIGVVLRTESEESSPPPNSSLCSHHLVVG